MASHQQRTEIRDGMRIDWDVPITMDDGLVLRADIFRPMKDGKYPVILSYGPYAKSLAFQDGYPSAWQRMADKHPDVTAGSSNLYQSWEVVDPEKWVPHDYVCVRVDSRGAGCSPGFIDHFSPRETKDFYDCIEWAGVQPWSNGKVGLNGISYYGINQWHVASLQPPHLSAMCVWEGAADWYRDMDVKLIIEDEQGKGDVAVTKAKKLVLQDKVHMLIGGVLASTGYALAPVSTELKTMYIPSIPAADDLTQRQLKNFPYLIRTSWSSSQPNHPLGQWACDQGYKKIVTIAADYAFGYETVGGFQKAFEDCGGKIIQKIWPPLGAKDFGPFIPTIKADTDAVFSLMVGPMPAQFIKQMRGAGFKKPIIGGGTSYDEFVLPFMLPLALVVVILGGTGSLLGSFVGSIIVGFIYNFGQALLPELAYFVLFLPMLLVLLLRPQGLFGRHVP